MKVLIMGCGRVGALVATALWSEGHQVMVMDTNAESFRRLPQDLQDTAVVGDGTLEEDLRKAGIEEADSLVAVSARDTSNLLAAQMAKHVFRIKKVVCRVNDPARYEIYTQLGLEAVSPTQIISDLIIQAVHR
ncbi:MAG: TrkA family potassium uptake protein [Chloroflexi bacterium]|nr:TrkA family potassium uptake protein [Chloroflexota bacterium]